MLKFVQAISLALAGLGMASAHAADAKFDAFMQTVSGNKTTVTFGSGGTPVLTSSAPLGTPSIGNMGFETSGGDVYMRSKGAARLPTGGTVPIDTKLKLTRNALAKGLAKSTLFYTAWETGSALYDIWVDFGLQLENGTVVSGTGDADISSGYMWRTIPAASAPYVYAASPEAVCNLGAIERSNYYPGMTFTGTLISYGSQCSYRYVGQDRYTSPHGTTAISQLTCPSGQYITKNGCQVQSPTQILTSEQIEAVVSELLANEGWPDADARAAADALRIPQVQAEVLPLIEAQPETDTQVQVQGIPQGTPFQVGDPVTTTTTQTNPDGTTSEKVQTTTTTATATGNTIQTQRQTQTTTTTRDAAGVVTGTTTATTTTAQTSSTPQEGEDLECGLPDGPPCKIDEEGTPQPVENDAQDAIDDLFRPLTECMDDPMSCLPELPDVNWAFTFPSTCGAISLSAFAPFIDSIDICQYQSIFHDLMSMLWAAAGVFGAIAMVGSANRRED